MNLRFASIASIANIASIASTASIASIASVASIFKKVLYLDRLGPIDRTPGIPGSDKNGAANIQLRWRFVKL